MDAAQTDLREIKAAAKNEFGHLPGIEGFGIGDGTLRVYIRNSDARKDIPVEFHGVPIDFVVTGDIRARSTGS